MKLGIDISNHQRTISWPDVAQAGVTFAIAKASEGNFYRDPYYQANRNNAKANGIVFCSYHFCRPSSYAGREEALTFLTTIGSVGLGMPLAFDMEDEYVPAGADLLAYSLDYVETIEEKTGVVPILYSRISYMEEHNLIGETAEHRKLARSGLWLASYNVAMPAPPKPWPFITVWQWSEKGSVPGVSGLCDMDFFNGEDITQLTKYGKQLT